MIFHRRGAGQYLQCLIRVLAKRRTDKDGGNVGAHGEQVIDELRYALVVETRQRFKNIQTRRFPEVIHFGRFAVLDRQPAIAGQSLQHFT